MEILDCTLRDGGYYTNWDFDFQLLEGYVNNISPLPVDYVEIGYRSIEKNDYHGEFFYLPLTTIADLKSRLPDKKLVIMLNAKDCNPSCVKALLKDCHDCIDLIRVAIDPKNISPCLELMWAIKSEGFRVAANFMYMSKPENHEIVINHLPDYHFLDCVNVVDSYGGIFPDELTRLIKILKLKSNLNIGFHGHNNLQMALANSIAAINAGANVIDATVSGMGRGAGNLKLELLLLYLQHKKMLSVDLDSLNNLVDVFRPLHNTYQWETNMAYMITGINSLPQDKVMSLIEKKRYSLDAIVNAVKNNITTKTYRFNSLDSNVALTEPNSIALLVGGGDIERHIKGLKSLCIANPSLVIIHSSTRNLALFSSFANQQIVVITGNESKKLDNIIPEIDLEKYIYVLSAHHKQFNSPIKTTLLHRTYEIEPMESSRAASDSPLGLALECAFCIKSEKIYMAGFDGYKSYNVKMNAELYNENQQILNSLAENARNVISITPTSYSNIQVQSLYKILEQETKFCVNELQTL